MGNWHELSYNSDQFLVGLGSRGVGGCIHHLWFFELWLAEENRSSFECKYQIDVSGHNPHSASLIHFDTLEMVERRKEQIETLKSLFSIMISNF